jgi:hypothetical protein
MRTPPPPGHPITEEPFAMPETPLTDDALARRAGADLVRLMWCGGVGPTAWAEARGGFARMWGGDSESDVAEVDRLLSAGARALGTRSVPTVIRDRDARSVQPTELAEHWSRSIGAALAAGRFGAVELSAFFGPFRACVELGDELMRIHFEAEGLARRRGELLDQEALLWASAQEAGRESDLAWARGRAERARERDEAIDSGTRRRLAAGRAFSGARGEAKGAEQRLAVAERRLAAGRATPEEVERARDLLRRAEQERDEAKAALDRVDEEIGAARDRRRQVTTPGDVRRHNRTEIERFQARTHEEAAGLERRLREIERWHRDLCRSVAEQDAFHLERTQEAHRRRAADTVRAIQQHWDARERKLAEQRRRERSAALGDPQHPAPTGPAASSGPPPVEEAIRALRERYGSPGDPAPGDPARAGDREGPSSGPAMGFALPAVEPAPSGPAEGRGDAGAADGESPWSPPPIGFAFPGPQAEGTGAS